MHDDDHDHEHHHSDSSDFGVGLTAEDIEGLEMFTLRSVGIDIGSSTSHLVFSDLTLRREGAAFSSRFQVTDRAVLYRSRILLTPYTSANWVDDDGIRRFIHDAYREAGVTADEVDTGAVVITGEALKKENAQALVEGCAKDSGKFICVSAGPNHEALLAAHGCGAVALSRAEKSTILNVDVGGGTAKLSVIRQGVVTETAAVSVGARLIAFDDSGVVTRIEAPARLMMGELEMAVALGKKISQKEQEGFADLMAQLLFEVIQGGRLSPLAKELMVTDPLKGFPNLNQIDCVIFSGGVSEYIYGHDRTSYGDVGPLFGKKIRNALDRVFNKRVLREPTEGIRATVIGAGEYTIQASGNTSYISGTEALPAFGLKVVRPFVEKGGSMEEGVRKALAKFDLPCFTSGLALALSLKEQQDYRSLRSLAEGIAAVLEKSDDGKAPLFLVLDLDVAKSLGGILKEELNVGREVVAVDGIDVGDLDYIDLGRPMGASEVLPVTVKSLMFPSSSRG